MIKTESLEILGKNGMLIDLINFVRKKTEELQLVPIVSFYLEDKLLKDLIKNLDPLFKRDFKELKWSRDMFVSKILVNKESNREPYHYFSYYAYPISESYKIVIVENNWIPIKAKLVEGEFRLTFQFYNDFNEMMNTIQKQDEDDIIIEVSNSRVVSVKVKRNIFIEKKTLDEALNSKLPLVTNLILDRQMLLLLSVLGNNVYPFKNEVEVVQKNDIANIKGKGKEDDIMNGNTLTMRTKAEIYYDYKTKNINKEKEVLLEALTYKLS